MGTTSSGILNDSHRQQIQNALDVISRMKAEIDLAKRAGIDVSAQEQQMTESEQKLRQLKNVYFPNS